MDVTQLYDLRERLKAGAIAGCGLIAEDFRLIRSLEALAPLEAVAPVFARIGQSVRAMLAPDCTDRAGALCDALALCDAVLTTQAGTAVSEPIEPIEIAGDAKAAVANAPYSVLAPLLEALTTSGSGRYSFVIDTKKQMPALFADYRVKHALVAALGASYAELADTVQGWLCEEDCSLLPLLKKGFDPQGKKEMVRRLRVIEEISKQESNHFYLALLEDDRCDKELRATAIYALRHCEGNAERLIALTKTEKGNLKKTALWALSKLSSAEAWDYWNALAAKKPEQAAEYMALSTTAPAGELVATSLLSMLEAFEQGRLTLTKETAEPLRALVMALMGKSGEKVSAAYRKAAALGERLDQHLPGEQRPALFSLYGGGPASKALPFGEAMPQTLLATLLLHPTDELLALANELGAALGGWWAAPQLMAALLQQPADAVWELGKKLAPSSALLGLVQKSSKQSEEVLERTLGLVRWNEETKRQVLVDEVLDPAQNRMMMVQRPLRENLDARWYEALCHKPTRYDDLLITLIQPDHPALCQQLARHFYQRACITADNSQYLQPLRALGWTKCEGIAVRRYEGKKNLGYWEIEGFIRRLPGSKEAHIAELDRVIALIEQKKCAMSSVRGIESLQALVKEMRAAALETV